METPNSPVALTEGSAEETFIIIFHLESIKNYTIYGMEAIFITMWKVRKGDLSHQIRLVMSFIASAKCIVSTCPSEKKSQDDGS